LIILGKYDIFDTKFYEEKSQNRRNIVLIPGALSNRKILTFTAESLAKKNFRVIAMDLPGLGSRYNEKLTVQSALDCVKEIITKECGGKAIVFGYAMGGYLAMRFMKEFPEMCTAVVLGGCLNEWYGPRLNVMASFF